MLELLEPGTLAALIGLFGGLILGLAARLGRFCSMGAIEDALYQGSNVRARQWALALGVALIGTFALIGSGHFDPTGTVYLALKWYPLASITGGLLFGYGMALAGNCGFGALARLGGGDLRNFVIVLVMGLSTYVTLNGPLAALRVALFPTVPSEGATPGLAHGLGESLGLPVAAIGLLIGVAFIALALFSAEFRKKRAMMFWGVAVGLAIVSGWAGTAWLYEASFEAEPLSSHTFAAPIGDTLFYLMTSSASSLNFGVGSVVGVLAGAAIGSLIKGHFRWEACEDARELKRQIIGAALMGIGAVVAFGCTVGQGLSAFSVLAYSAPITIASIVAGAAFGLHQLIYGFSFMRAKG
ncbi:YeeE/YedE family protein [Celeribacter litoreus]|uniref:YeeE/YedE family protein n=1 Tax=Celeribacter litoreus TaxID=2876714 RepID=UPI001CCBE8FB|nr:YeeE/YedE family protein [Celeribacter litoreus]MCA0044535.1 YeeE/YedE family protein [Celeribacter litoreus]